MTETISERDAGPRAGGCVHHPDRVPLGRCASCRRPVCGECHVRLDGILHCRECLQERERALGERRAPLAGRVVTLLAALAVLGPALAFSLVMMRGLGFAAGRVARIGAVAMDGPVAEDAR